MTDKKSWEVSPFIFFTEGKNGFKYFCPQRLGEFIKQYKKFRTIDNNDKEIYIYSKGVYKPNGKAFIKKFGTYLLKHMYQERYITEVISYIKNTTHIKADEIDNKFVNLRNGLLNPETLEFISHSPEVFNLHQLPFDYNTKADCPIFVGELQKKCKGWKFDTIQEMFGYCLVKDQRFERAFLLYGGKRTMKSTLLYVLNQMLGSESVTAMSLQKLEEDRYAQSYLFGMLANICADISAGELKSTGNFLKITGGDKITAGGKFQNEISFFPFAKLIFSCNIVPPTKNKDLAFYRRWIPLEFNITHEKIDVNMKEKLCSELSGIFNWALEGRKRLIENGKFSCPFSDEDIKDIYERNSNSIQSFIYNCIDCSDDEGSITKREVYAKYEEFCAKNRLNKENQIKFGRDFFAYTGCGSKKIGTIPAYTGVHVKLEEEKKEIIPEEKLHD